MKKLLASVAFAALMSASGSAFALDLGLASVVTGSCVVPNAGASPTLGFVLTGAGVVPAGGPTLLASIPGSYCNGPAKVSIKTAHGAVTAGGANAPIGIAPGGFANHIPYTAVADWDGLIANISALNVAPNTVVSAANAGPATGTLTVKASTPGTGGLPLVAGSYSDTLTVQIIPN
jgi:hypothetical protein